MYQPKLKKDIRCPLEYGLDVFGGKLNSRVICVLAAKKTLHYSNLRDEMGNITDSILSSTLKSLISNGIVMRIQYNEIPPHVEYKLTAKGESLIPILLQIYKWSGAYFKPDINENAVHCQKCDYTN